MRRTIFLEGHNEMVIKKGQGPNRRSRSGTVGQKNGGKYRRSRFRRRISGQKMNLFCPTLMDSIIAAQTYSNQIRSIMNQFFPFFINYFLLSWLHYNLFYVFRNYYPLSFYRLLSHYK